MSDVNELAAALVAFQASVPTIPKNRVAKIPTKNGGSYSYNYADLTDMWDAIRTPLKENGLAVTQSLVGGSSGWTGIKTAVWHSSGQSFAETVEMQTQGRSPQEIGSQITYFKRYALGAVLGIATDDDDDGTVASNAPVQSSNVVTLADLKSAADRACATKEDVAAFVKADLNTLSQSKIKAAVDHFTELAVKKELQ
jgi:hypothetical protein